MKTADWLPTWDGPRGGSGCDNEECPASNRYVTVLSVEEIKRVFPRKRNLPYWPIAHQVTHMCTRCGEMYGGMSPNVQFSTLDADLASRPQVPIEQWDWDPEDAWDVSVREAVERFIEGAPESVDSAQLIEGVQKHVPGAGRTLARKILTEQGYDLPGMQVGEYV